VTSVYELRVQLPHLSDDNPNIERMKRELIDQVRITGALPAYVGIGQVQLLKVEQL